MDSITLEQTSDRYVGQWRQLVSTTNWDKGQIIYTWRCALVDSAAPASDYSDEAWSQRVGNVTPQHVGRLRRVFERFDAVRANFPGLYWSHFQAAIDWNDAEMWLEGAVLNQWSISEMRAQRAEVFGQARETAETHDVLNDWDPSEEIEPGEGPAQLRPALGEVFDPGAEALHQSAVEEPCNRPSDQDDSRDGDAANGRPRAARAASEAAGAEPAESLVTPRPFASLPSLPSDVTDAFEAYKLCIVRHKSAGWAEISLDDLLASLAALQEFALVPPSDD